MLSIKSVCHELTNIFRELKQKYVQPLNDISLVIDSVAQ